jgi:paraquat-inducible protein B
MNDADHESPPPLASTKRSRHVSAIWLVPLVAVAIGGWLAWDTLSKEGPTVTISFDTAEGLQAGQSQLKFKDIAFGTVKSLDLAPDHQRVIATVSTIHQVTPLLNDKTVFWVVKPRLFAGNISGLSTILSGSYIGMLPGPSGGKPQKDYVGLEDPPILEASTPGHTFRVKADRLGSISLGSPVFYRDIDVGQVLGWDFSDMARDVTIRVFVRAPFDGYVHDDSHFWNASGFDVKFGTSGIALEVESLRAVLLGGIAFDTPPTSSAGPVSADNHVFPLFANHDAAQDASYTQKMQMISYFPGSVRGLGPGSDVTFHGLTVGHVTSVRLAYDPVKDTLNAPVRYEVEPERVLGIGAKRVFPNVAEGVGALLKHGLRASLQSSNLITGQQLIAMDLVENAPPVAVAMEGDDFVIPTTDGGGLSGLQTAANDLLAKIGSIPFKQIGDNLNNLLKATNDVADSSQMRKALADLSATVGNASAFIQNLNTGTSPALKQLPGVASDLNKTLNTATRLMNSLDKGYGDDTKFNRDLERLLVQLNDAVTSIRSLADLLARHPDALLVGRNTKGIE